MKRTVFRGISFNEGQNVVVNQKYNRNEPRDFLNGVQAKSIFGSGLYLISDYELAAQYAFCHAEVEDEEVAVVLKQQISLKNPFILNHRYTEDRLRKNAFSWKYSGEPFPNMDEAEDSLELMQWIGSVIKEYLLHNDYDGIIYHLDDEVIYYVSYFQEEQIKDISFDFSFNIDELKNNTVPFLRENYKKLNGCMNM